VFRTAGADGWGDPLERPPADLLRAAEQAERAERGGPPQLDFGELPDGVIVT
jgi:hypothetical protein